MLKVIAIIQARMGSTRLPAKIMADLAGEPMLVRVVRRCQRAVTLNEIIVATTSKPADDAVERLCVEYKLPWFRGSEDDLLDRYYQVATQQHADVVVRITSDCPLIEPDIIDLVVRRFLENSPVDYVSNTLPPRTFPRGLDVEAISFAALARAWREDANPAWREHATPFIYRNPDKFRLLRVTHAVDYSQMRWTVDTSEDLDLVQKIYEHFRHDRFSWRQVLALLEQHPRWLEINQHVAQKEVR